MDGASLTQAISDLGDDRPIPGSLINRRARLLEVLSIYEARPVRDWLLAGDADEKEVEDVVDSNAADSDRANSEISSERISGSAGRLPKKGKRSASSRRHKGLKRRKKSRSSSGSSSSDSDSSSASSSASSSSSDQERLNLGQDFVPDLLDRGRWSHILSGSPVVEGLMPCWGFFLGGG
ncbi:hypothetical protein BC829DRAFT_445564 [Chytridium lagenaria]|nr:hypothetical protein BC829DRAFT_445564 [Chytridium lagenaria]